MAITDETIRRLAAHSGVTKVDTLDHGWHLTLHNGVLFSIQVGPHHYRNDGTAEIAAWWIADQRWLWQEQVRGWQTEAEIDVALTLASRRKRDE